MMAGINIWSGERGLGGALTNPTSLTARKGQLDRSWSATPDAGYPVRFRGRTYVDAEAAYQAHKTGTDADLGLMVEVLVAKLEQHPRLTDEITRRGRTAFLERCSHFVGRPHLPGQSGYARRSGWEWTGDGRTSKMVDCLIRAYEGVMATWVRAVAAESPPHSSAARGTQSAADANGRVRAAAQAIVDADPDALEAVLAAHPQLRERLLRALSALPCGAPAAQRQR